MAVKKLTKEIDKQDARVKYQAAISLFTSEGQILWTRFSAMLAINALMITLLSIDFNFPPFLKIVISIAGIIFCFLWYQMTKRGFMWINHWIFEANKIEDQINGEVNPVKNGEELRKKVGENVTERNSLCIIKIIGIIYLILLIINLFNEFYLGSFIFFIFYSSNL